MTHIVAADTLYVLHFMEEVSAQLGWAWEPREVRMPRQVPDVRRLLVVQPAPHLSPERLEHLRRLVDAFRLRAALYPAPKLPPVRNRSRSRQYPGGRSSRWRTGRGRLHSSLGYRSPTEYETALAA